MSGPPPATATIRLVVNGAERSVAADDDAMPLLHALRQHCELAGPRFGCGAAQCGACYVLLDGQPAPACDTPLWSAAGKAVTTVEGLAAWAGGDGGGALHPLQQAFIDEQAAQCGFCLSGILVSAAALLAREPQPDEAAVRAALDRHLCRCGSHNRIVRAVLRAAAAMRAPAAAA